jgi:DNA-binding MarR family transcriptional regulator
VPNEKRRWFLLSTHGLCLMYVFFHQEARVAEIADEVGITERRAGQVVRDLEEEGYLVVQHEGRRKRYTVNGAALGRHPLFSHLSLDDVALRSLSRLLFNEPPKPSRTGDVYGKARDYEPSVST